MTRKNFESATYGSYGCSVTNRIRFYFYVTARYITVRYGSTSMDQRYITVSYVTLRYVRVENTH